MDHHAARPGRRVLARCLVVFLLASLATLGLEGCGFGRRAETYALNAQIPPHPVARPVDKVLQIPVPSAQPGFDTVAMAYTKTPSQLGYYSRSQWADTPAHMLAPLVVRALADTGAFRSVVTPPADGDLRLELDIIDLQQELWERPSRVRLTVRAKLVDVATRHVLSTQLFEALEPAPEETALGGVQAADAAVRRVLEDLRQFVVSSTPGVKVG